jgi:hypothetical protein
VRLFCGIEQGERFGGAADRPSADVARVRKARHLARHGAEAKARVGRIVGGLEPPVVETEALGRAILQVQLAVVGFREGFARERLRQIGVERVGAIEEAAGIGRACHCEQYRGAQPSTQRPVRRGLIEALCRGAGFRVGSGPLVNPGESRGPVRKHARSALEFWAPAFAGVHISIGSLRSKADAGL